MDYDDSPKGVCETESLGRFSDHPIIWFFESGHLCGELRAIAVPVETLAALMICQLPPGPELSAGLRKLLEAKDCFVRAALP